VPALAPPPAHSLRGGQLRAALDALDGPTWGRLKAAWRKRQERCRGTLQVNVNGALNRGKRLGPIWLRLIAWGVISEEDARFLAGASPATHPDLTFYDDNGAKLYLEIALGNQVDAVRRQYPQG
jgi:hypothetical protein